MIVITGGNSGQVRMALALADSLERHGWRGPRYFGTTGLDHTDQKLLTEEGGYHVFVFDTHNLVPEGSCMPAGMIAKPRMIVEALRIGEVDDAAHVAYLDADVLVQSEPTALSHEIKRGEILMGAEVLKPINNRATRAKWRASGRDLESLRELRRELCNGVMLGTAGAFRRTVPAWLDAIRQDAHLLAPGKGKCWHDMDYLRTLRGTPGFPSVGRVSCKLLWTHTPAAARAVEVRVHAPHFVIGRRRRAPVIVHFAGGTWRLYGWVAAKYQRSQVAAAKAFIMAPANRLAFEARWIASAFLDLFRDN